MNNDVLKEKLNTSNLEESSSVVSNKEGYITQDKQMTLDGYLEWLN